MIPIEKMFQIDSSHVGTMAWKDSYVRELEHKLAETEQSLLDSRLQHNLAEDKVGDLLTRIDCLTEEVGVQEGIVKHLEAMRGVGKDPSEMQL